jgi:GNAT superfamily N-acetyltransferase
MSLHIRTAEPRDLDAVLALVRALADFEKLPPPDAEAAARFREHAFRHFELLVAELDGEVVAYAVHFATYSTFLARPSLWLEDLFVRPDVRSRGIGAAMLRRLAQLAVERGCGRFEWSVLDWNARAQSFYAGLGAELLREWHLCRVTGDALAQLGAAN